MADPQCDSPTSSTVSALCLAPGHCDTENSTGGDVTNESPVASRTFFYPFYVKGYFTLDIDAGSLRDHFDPPFPIEVCFDPGDADNPVSYADQALTPKLSDGDFGNKPSIDVNVKVSIEQDGPVVASAVLTVKKVGVQAGRFPPITQPLPKVLKVGNAVLQAGSDAATMIYTPDPSDPAFYWVNCDQPAIVRSGAPDGLWPFRMTTGQAQLLSFSTVSGTVASSSLTFRFYKPTEDYHNQRIGTPIPYRLVARTGPPA